MPPMRAPKRATKKTSKKQGKKEFVWTDDEAQLLLEVAHDYKLKHLAEGVCWESVKTKYVDILELFRKELPQNAEEAKCLAKDYSHKPNEVSKEILTSKLKAIRIKFREAVDDGRRSGHGRVVYLYYELCAKLWGGSPATEQIGMGIETEEVNEQVNINDELAEALAEASGIDADNEDQTRSSQQSSTEFTSESTSDDPATVTRKRRRQLDEVLSTYKIKNMKKRISGDVQLAILAEKELKLKQQMVERLDSISKDHKAMAVLTQNLRSISDTMSSAVALLQQSLMQRSNPVMPVYYNQYRYPPHPSPGSSYCHTQSICLVRLKIAVKT